MMRAFCQMTSNTKLSRIVLHYGDDFGSVSGVMDFNFDISSKLATKLSQAGSYFDESDFINTFNYLNEIGESDIELISTIIKHLSDGVQADNLHEAMGLNNEDSDDLTEVIRII
jgi:hypothetical protein